jgi:hypothetical protein
MHYLRLLFWLKWKLMWRSYRSNTTATVGVLLTILVFLPISLVLAVATALGYVALDPPWNEHLLRGVLLGVYAFWILSPLIGYALNDSYDITRLFVYPVSLRQIFLGAVCGSVVDFPVLLLLPTFLGALIGFTHSPVSFGLVVLPLALFLFHTLSLSQALILVSAGVLRSRRFRDIVMVLIPLLWMAYYVFSQMLSRNAVHVDWKAFVGSRAWDMLSYLPPGLAARAVAASGQGEFLLTGMYLAALGAFTVAAVYLAAWLIQAVYAGEEVGPGRRRRAGAQPVPPVRTAPSAPNAVNAFSRSLPPVVQAVADKEMKYFFRDPYFKIALMNLVYMLFVGVFMLWRQSGHGGNSTLFNTGAMWGVTGLLLLSEMQLLFNFFGPEGGAATVLFLFPGSRKQMLIGKNLPTFAALSVVNITFLLILASLAGALGMLGPLFLWMELALLVFLAVGNLVSIWFPYRLTAQGWRMRPRSAGQGCGYGLIYLGVFFAGITLLLPVLLGLVLPAFEVIPPAWFGLTIPLSGVYAIALYVISLRMAEPLLLQRETNILERLCQTD